jgi:phosphoribosylglycinamide formyltransferase-1
MLSEKVRIAVFVSGGGTNLQAILDEAQKGNIPDGEIVLVLSNNPNAYALERAKAQNVKAVCVSKAEFPTLEEREAETIRIMEENKIGLIVLAGYLSILSENFTKRYIGRIINIHPSLIPSFCGKGYYGLKVHEAALAYGVKVTGATVHYANEIPDGGQIIAQKAVYIEEGDTPESLQQRVMREAEWIILPQAVETVCKRLRGENK